MILDRKAIIFDLDGTLIDSLGIWSQVDQALIKRLSRDAVDVTEEEAYAMRAGMMKRYGEGSDAYFKYCADLKAKYGMPGTSEEIHRQRYEIAAEFLRTRVNWRPGVPELLHALKAAGLKLAIATTTRRRNIDVYADKNDAMRQTAPIRELFDLVVTRDDVSHVKPDPEAFVKALEAFSLPPEACLVVEDALPGIRGARAAGIDSAVMSERHSNSPELRAALDAEAVVRYESAWAMLEALRREEAEQNGGCAS